MCFSREPVRERPSIYVDNQMPKLPRGSSEQLATLPILETLLSRGEPLLDQPVEVVAVRTAFIEWVGRLSDVFRI